MMSGRRLDAHEGGDDDGSMLVVFEGCTGMTATPRGGALPPGSLRGYLPGATEARSGVALLSRSRFWMDVSGARHRNYAV